MNYIADDRDIAELANGLNELSRIVEQMRVATGNGLHPEYYRACSAINSLRGRIARFARIQPFIERDGSETELIDASWMYECGTHGLGFVNDREDAADANDCPLCQQEAEDMEAAVEAEEDSPAEAEDPRYSMPDGSLADSCDGYKLRGDEFEEEEA